MPDVVIENPILNSPFEEPGRHFRFSEDGITNEIVEARRVSSYFIPIPKPKKRGKALQLAFDTEWTKDRIEENIFINRIRERVSLWRKGDYQGITKTTRRLLDYWRNPERERKLFFCQIEAAETAIYITEVANKYGDSWIENELRRANEDANPELFRIAFKMATGSGKTVVMAMLIAWHVLNKLANPQDARFSDTFLIVTPGITIRDRLRVLLPNDPQNYYRQRDILPAEWMEELGRAKIIITNFHAFKLRELVTIPYTLEGEDRNYIPDFIVRMRDGKEDLLNLMIEVTGEKKKDKAAKVSTARNLWVPAVNNHGGFGRWVFLEIADPWDAKNLIRAFLEPNVSNLTEVQ